MTDQQVPHFIFLTAGPAVEASALLRGSVIFLKRSGEVPPLENLECVFYVCVVVVCVCFLCLWLLCVWCWCVCGFCVCVCVWCLCVWFLCGCVFCVCGFVWVCCFVCGVWIKWSEKCFKYWIVLCAGASGWTKVGNVFPSSKKQLQAHRVFPSIRKRLWWCKLKKNQRFYGVL